MKTRSYFSSVVPIHNIEISITLWFLIIMKKKRDYNYFGSDRPKVVFINSWLRIMFTQRKTQFAVPLTAFPLFFVFTWWISNIFKIIFVSMSLLPAWSLSFFFTYLTKFPNFSLEIYWKHTPQVVASCSDPKDHGTNKILAFWHICIKLRYTCRINTKTFQSGVSSSDI